MMILLISMIVGVMVAVLVSTGMTFYKKMQIEKRLKGKFDELTEIRRVGMVGNIIAIASRIGTFLEKLHISVFDRMTEKTKTKLSILGAPYTKISPYTFLGIQFLLCLGTVIICVVLLSMYNVILLVLFGVCGFFVSELYIAEKVKLKHKTIFKQLPDVLDMLTLMVEAGLDFGNALNKIIVESENNCLIDEFRKAQQEIKLGKSRIVAFEDMSNRLCYLPLSAVITSLNLAFKTGGSIAPTLRVLSEQFRVERSQLAEKLANEAPLKLMAPLIILIFPTIFIILFGPIVLSFLQGTYW